MAGVKTKRDESPLKSESLPCTPPTKRHRGDNTAVSGSQTLTNGNGSVDQNGSSHDVQERASTSTNNQLNYEAEFNIKVNRII